MFFFQSNPNNRNWILKDTTTTPIPPQFSLIILSAEIQYIPMNSFLEPNYGPSEISDKTPIDFTGRRNGKFADSGGIRTVCACVCSGVGELFYKHKGYFHKRGVGEIKIILGPDSPKSLGSHPRNIPPPAVNVHSSRHMSQSSMTPSQCLSWVMA